MLRPVPTELRWLDPSLCLNELVDLDHDHRLDAVVRFPLRELGDPAPWIALPLLLDDRPAFAPDAWPDGYAQAEISRREAALEVATDRADADAAARLAIELAVVVALRGGSDADIEARLGAARALPLSSEATDRLQAARAAAIALRARSRPPDPEEPGSDEPASDEPASDERDRGPSSRDR